MSASSKQNAIFEFDAFGSYSTDPDYRLVRQTESFLESFHKRGPVDALLEEACRRLTYAFSFTEQEKSIFFDSEPRVTCKDHTYSAEHVGE